MAHCQCVASMPLLIYKSQEIKPQPSAIQGRAVQECGAFNKLGKMLNKYAADFASLTYELSL